MLDKLLGAVAHKLDAYKNAVSKQRATIERERAGDTARPHAGREFENSEGFTTPLPKAAQNSQNEYARIRRDYLENGGSAALSLAIALMFAREKRDESAAALKKHEEAEAARQATGVHHEVKAAFGLMFKHGLEPRHVANVRPQTTAIIADLLRWDGEDPDWKDADSPVAAVFEIYAMRRVMIPGQLGDKGRSRPGCPPARVRGSDPRYYQFERAGPLPAPTTTEPLGEVATPGDERDHAEVSAGIMDCSTYSPDLGLPTPPAEAPVDDSEDEVLPFTQARARAVAEIVADNHPYRMAYYWPAQGIDRDDFNPGRLVPALQRRVDGGAAWSGAVAFLEAAREGKAEEFIDERRRAMVEDLTRQLLEGNERAIGDAVSLGLTI